MNQNNIIKILVPVLAVVVLAESVILISRFNKRQTILPLQNQTSRTNPTATGEVKNGIYTISISSDKTSYKVGEQGTVTVKMTGSEARSLDAIDLYVKYDPKSIDASGLSFDKKLPVPSFSKVSTIKSLLVANFLVSNPAGLSLKANESLTLMTFKIKAVKAGTTNFEISTGNSANESATMIVENRTSKPLPFSSSMLSINVAE